MKLYIYMCVCVFQTMYIGAKWKWEWWVTGEKIKISSTRLYNRDLLIRRLIWNVCFCICHCFGWAFLRHLTFTVFIFVWKASQVSTSSKVPACNGGLLLTPRGVHSGASPSCVYVVFCLSVDVSPLTCFDTWIPKHCRTPDLTLAGATSLGLSLGCSFAPAASATSALRDLHKLAEHKRMIAVQEPMENAVPAFLPNIFDLWLYILHVCSCENWISEKSIYMLLL